MRINAREDRFTGRHSLIVALPSIASMLGVLGFSLPEGLMRVLYVCTSFLLLAVLAVGVLGMTVSQCRPSMFVPDNPYLAKAEHNWIANCANVFGWQPQKERDPSGY